MNIFQGIRDFLDLRRHMYHFTEREPKAYQEREVLSLVNDTLCQSRFYRSWYGKTHIETMEEFYHLPTINRQIMMEHLDDLNTCGLKLEEVMRFAVDNEKTRTISDILRVNMLLGSRVGQAVTRESTLPQSDHPATSLCVSGAKRHTPEAFSFQDSLSSSGL